MPEFRLSMNDHDWGLLEDLRARTGANGYSDIIRNALKIYDFLVTEGDLRARVVYNAPDGTTKMVRLFE